MRKPVNSGFVFAETECTQGQWDSVMVGNPSSIKGPDGSVENVGWDDAVAYC